MKRSFPLRLAALSAAMHMTAATAYAQETTPPPAQDDAALDCAATPDRAECVKPASGDDASRSASQSTRVTESSAVTEGDLPIIDCLLDPGAIQCVFQKITIGDPTTQAIDTNLLSHHIPANIGPLYIGNTAYSADAITIDSGSNFPPGIAFRRYLGPIDAPEVVTAGTQLGYFDFRAYTGSEFWNVASFDVVVDPLIDFQPGGFVPTKMRFAISNTEGTFIPMELNSAGRLELGAIVGSSYYGPGTLGNSKFFVNTLTNDWSTILTSRPETGSGYVLRLHSLGETADDYLIGGSSGAGTGTFKFSVRGNGDTFIAGKLMVGATDVGQTIADTAASLAVVGDTADTALIKATASAEQLTAFAVNGTGDAASATGVNSVAIGRGSVADQDNTVSFGTAGHERRLTDVAEAVDATDAINKGQFDTTVASLSNGTSAVRTLAEGAQDTADTALIKATASAEQLTAFAVNGTGDAASATGVNSVAIGRGSVADQDNTASFGAVGHERRLTNIAQGVDATDAVNKGQFDVALAALSDVTQTGVDAAKALAQGAQNLAAQNEQLLEDHSGKLKYFSTGSTGADAVATGADAVAIGGGAQATSATAIAVGHDAVATGANALVLGNAARGNGASAIAIGDKGIASGQGAVAIGSASTSTGVNGTAVGTEARALRDYATAIGVRTLAQGAHGVAIGDSTIVLDEYATAVGSAARASGQYSSAFGAYANAANPYSMAFGYMAMTTRANQIVMGTVNYTYTFPGLSKLASNNAQSGDLYYVTVDAAGNLGYVTTPVPTNGSQSASGGSNALAASADTRPVSTASLAPTVEEPAVTASADASEASGKSAAKSTDTGDGVAGVSADTSNPSELDVKQRVAGTTVDASAAVTEVTSAQFDALSGRVSSAENRIDAVEARLDVMQGQFRQLNGGIAAAMAMGGTMILPDKTVSVSFNLATYRGEQGFSGAAALRLTDGLYISGGVTGSTVKGSTGGRVGFSFGF